MAGVHIAQPGTPLLRIVDRVGADRPTRTKLGTGRTTVGLQVPINFVMIGRRELSGSGTPSVLRIVVFTMAVNAHNS